MLDVIASFGAGVATIMQCDDDQQVGVNSGTATSVH
jgi:hypothetical protein